MANLTDGEFEAVLQPDEVLRARVPIDGFYASEHHPAVVNPQIVITDRRFILFSVRGTFKKHCEIEASWPLTCFTNRLNSNEGAPFGTFLNWLALFPSDGETVLSGFNSKPDRDAFKLVVSEAIGDANGW